MLTRLVAAVNPEFLGNTGKNPPPSAARGAVRRGGFLIRFPVLFNVTQSAAAARPSRPPPNRDKMTGMAASPYVKALDEIQKALTGFLKPLGFKKKGRTYNRQVGDGLVQAVNLQMGQYPIGDYVIPGLRESHYGRFTVNLGVALPAVRALESGREFPVFVQEYEFDTRQRLTRLAFNEDAWFDLDGLRASQTARARTWLFRPSGRLCISKQGICRSRCGRSARVRTAARIVFRVVV
jgi:hypothetical protein